MIDEMKAKEALESGYAEAEEILQDIDKTERLLQRAEQKLKVVPIVGTQLAAVPTMISLIRSFIKKEYTDIPIGSIMAAVSAVAYVVSHIDLIPDFVPVAGYLDDALVVTAALKLIQSDIDEYETWREENNKKI